MRATPARQPGSVRRTTSIDVAFPDGRLGRMVVDIRGRDVRTGPRREADVVDEVALTLELENAGVILGVSGVDGLGHLVGVNARRGFAKLVPTLLGGDRRTLLFSCLDDLGGILMVSGYSALRAGLLRGGPSRGPEAAERQADVCIGWARGTPVLETLRVTGRNAVPMGGPAPVIEGADAMAWHDVPPLAVGAVRRRRRLDVTGEPVSVDVHFRDSFGADDGEMALHEYEVTASFDGANRVSAIDARARSLPWAECPGATASAQRLVGARLEELAEHVRATVHGPSSCTHLTSTLRGLADVAALVPMLG